MGAARRVLASLAIIVAIVAVATVIENVALEKFFPHLPRLATDVSAYYLRRELRAVAKEKSPIVILGDSVLWGYRLPANRIAIELLRRRGCDCENLSFKMSSPPNYYALALLMQKYHVKPGVAVIEVNQRVFNPVNDAYRALHPSIAALADGLIKQPDLALLSPTKQIESPMQEWLAHLSVLYAMRTDVRETLYPQPDVVTIRRPTASMFEGEYDLSPLDSSNVGVHFLKETVNLLRRENIPTIAFTTPTNHVLMREYIDGPEYRSNNEFLLSLLKKDGVRVIDLDRAFPADEFYDNDHLTASGQARLAAILGVAVRMKAK